MTKVLSTSEGTHRGTFTALDWALFLSIGLIWGSSFILIATGLDAFRPGLITWLRVATGAAALWLLPGARVRVAREDLPGSSRCRSCGWRSRSRCSRSRSNT